ncbi:AraC family transcriptional regulator [Cupriavidus gilardii CR3]|uniref:Helix-turn-helix transcriptional regulator n=1 Tax=Cupriavidus gilardii TaxID=82541 RepID=A0A849BBV1_9BURK|nr:AraC family transcriptional regulator [Cupriavidus gilardii]ALD91035.1 AraC family transcriptional regulator [Cupriavidus gilardii CR3]KAB0596312.1 helix-turn-helix transcriptional regulator [Cupriavidus gilardii]MCT9012205.1 AraC family transcriptional regulator [Cupriavidus gilardii]MCT9053658.1 AraC family transcriptional regulator [Cupriavidus gilardii]NNH13330.1 helix-turn-helix transcriptional regulator [Cupriavidus gilardii]
MAQTRIGTDAIVASSVAQAQDWLGRHYPGITIEADGGEPRLEIQIDYLDGMAVHTLATDTPLCLRLPCQHDGYLLYTQADGQLSLATEQDGLRPLPAGTAVADARRVTAWGFGPGRYEAILIDAASVHGRLSQSIERPVMHRVKFAPPEGSVPSGVRFAGELVRAAGRYSKADGGPQAIAPDIVQSLQDAVIFAMLKEIPHNYSVYLARRHAGPSPRHVRRAIEYIHANARAALGLADIALAARVSIRTLQAGFARFKGFTPMGYVKRVRLEGVHADLRTAGAEQSIADIARRWGFSHLGQFARDYRMAFGETPSQTRRGD